MKMPEDCKFIAAATNEVLNPTFAITRQYLEVMDLAIENGSPIVARIDRKHSESSVAVYLHIKNERFFIVIVLSKEDPVKPLWVYIESAHRVYLTATSDTLTYNELSNHLAVTPLSGWSKGDLREKSGIAYKFSRVSYEPNKNEAFGLEEKLSDLLIDLERDREGVISLSKVSNAYISICRHQYISGNAGLHLNKDTIRRLNEFNLELDIDTYICGNEIA